MTANKYRKMFSFLLSVLPFVVMMTPLQENIMIVIAYYKMIITYTFLFFIYGNMEHDKSIYRQWGNCRDASSGNSLGK